MKYLSWKYGTYYAVKDFTRTPSKISLEVFKMKKTRHILLFVIYKVLDLFILSVPLLLAAYIEGSITFDSLKAILSLEISIKYAVISMLVLAVWHTIIEGLGAYDLRKKGGIYDEILLIVKIVILSTLILAVTGALTGTEFGNIGYLQRFSLLFLMSVTVSRAGFWYLTEKVSSKGQLKRNVVIAGTGKRALRYAKILSRNEHLGYKVIGFIDTHVHSDEEKDASFLLNIVSDFANFKTYIRENIIDELLICLPVKTQYDNISMLIKCSEEQGVTVRVDADLFDKKLAQSKIDYIQAYPLVTLYTGAMNEPSVIIKYLIDFFGSLMLLILLFPIFIVAALSIKLTTKGPVFFTQERIGINKRLFRVFKFRTMVVNAEAKMADIEHLNDRKGQVTFKIKNDPRVTIVGKFLRKTSIDELPQLLNVLRGEMSLVGPRPLPVRDYKGFGTDWHRRRFSVKPGITCIWQISGRDQIPFERWMEMDMEYIDKWSLWLDLKILLKTIPTVLLTKGAS
ncbi:MAG TPA: sugar transferase [Chitinispirillaceae bacterium]|nr:sugar transferase [Chitinispirillaceae bacterium]